MKSVKLSIVLTNILIVCIAGAIIGMVSLGELMMQNEQEVESYEEAVRQGYDDSIKYQVQAAISLLDGIYARQQAGEMTEEEAQEEAKRVIKSLRYGSDGYFWIDATDYILVAHPMQEETEGQSRYDMTDENGVKLVQETVKVATENPEGGYVEFSFYKPGETDHVTPKRAYAMLFEPYGWVVSTGNYMDNIEEDILQRTSSMDHTLTNIEIQLFASVVVCILIAAILAFILAGRFTGPLKKIEELAHRLAKGDMSQNLNLKRRDEFGKAAASLDEAQDNIRVLLQDIANVTISIETAIENLNKVFQAVEDTTNGVTNAIADMAQGAVTQTESTKDATRHVSEMGDNIHTTVEYVDSLNEQSNEIELSSKEALATIQELGRINAQTRTQIEEIYRQTGTTNESVQKIKQATELINAIAEETNLLSLNASIEAARAGDAGRGFGVVADQISKLADQSSESVEQIEAVVKTLLENSDREVEIMSEVKEVIGKESEALEKVQEIFSSVYDGIGTSINAIRNISERATSLDDSRSSVIRIVSKLGSIAQQNAASTEETSASTTMLNKTVYGITEDMDRLRDSIEQLSGQVGRFKTQA